MSDGGVVTFGETLGLMFSSEPGPLAHASTLELGIGGAESNVAIALRRLGVPVTWVGRVGKDSIGDRIIRELRAEDVDIRAIRDATAPTGLMLKERRTSESTTVWYYRSGSAGSHLCPSDLDDVGIPEARLLHVTGITLGLSEGAAAAVSHAVDLARSNDTLVSFDVNHRSTLWKDRAPSAAYQDIASRSSIVFAGEDEARIMMPGAGDIQDLAAKIAALGPSHVVIKRGADGAYALIDGVEYWQPAFRVRVIDTVGAGDAFVAGYLADTLAGATVQDALVTGAAAGAFACMTARDWEGMPSRAELALLGNAEPVTR